MGSSLRGDCPILNTSELPLRNSRNDQRRSISHRPTMPQHHGKFVAYYRCSTERQGRSGLGLEVQQEAVRTIERT